MSEKTVFKCLLTLFLIMLSPSVLAWHLPFLGKNKSEENIQPETLITYKINGLNSSATKNAEIWLKANRRDENKPLLNNSEVNSLYQKAGPTVLDAIQPYGYFRAQIVHTQLMHPKTNEWTITIQVKPGPPLRLTHVRLHLSGPGAHQTTLVAYQANFPLKPGQPFNMTQYKAAKSQLSHLATEKGFLNAYFSKAQIKINRRTYDCDIVLSFDTGPQFYFGTVFFKQQALDDNFLQGYLPFHPGQSYTPSELMTLEQRLTATPYFQSVAVEPAPIPNNSTTVPINVTLVPSQSQRYNFGIGYGTDTGIRGTIGWMLPRITRDGQYFSSQLQASQIQTNLDARYVIPGKNPVTQQNFIAASITQQSPNTSNGHTQKLSIGHGDMLWGWKTIVSLSQQFDQYSLRGDPWQHSHLLLPELSFNKTTFDNPVFPSHGHVISLKLKGASTALLSSTSFLQTDLSGKWIMSPTTQSRLLLRGEIGETAVNNINTIPLSLQFFAGGSDSIRGYSYQELGPGKYLFISSLEYQHQVIEKWYAVTFFDMGNAVNSWSDPAGTAVGRKQPNNLVLSDLFKESVGLGALWVSPVGPMELTLAKPLSDPGKSLSLQFSMGTGL